MSDTEIEARFRSLLQSHGSLLRAAIQQTCPKDLGLDVDDIEQEARLRLWRALERESEITHPASYVYRVAVTATLDAIRRARARREDALPEPDADSGSGEDHRFRADPESSPERLAERRELARLVATAVERLADSRCRAVRLHLQGFSGAEIGRLLGWSEPKARNLTYRGLRDLRLILKALGVTHEAP